MYTDSVYYTALLYVYRRAFSIKMNLTVVFRMVILPPRSSNCGVFSYICDMVEAIAKLFDFLNDCWEDILPYFVVPQTQMAVVMRNGVYLKEAGPGPHLKMPKIFSLGDEVNYVDVITETTETDPQSLTTLDGYEIVVSTIIKHRVSDPKTYLLDVFDVKSAIVDITMSKVKKNVMTRTWEECKEDSLDNEIAKQTRVEAKKWGVHIEYVTVVNLAKMRSLRLISNNPFQ